LVFALTEAVPAVIAEARDDEAFVTSDVFARVPDVRVASVRLRVANDQTCEAVIPVARESCLPVVPSAMTLEVAMFQTSEARVPNVVRDRVVALHTPAGIVARSDVEAVKTVALVFELMVEMAEAIWELVFAFIPVAREVEAVRIAELVFALITEARDDEALSTVAFTDDVIPDV
jgi:hypothetical protein